MNNQTEEVTIEQKTGKGNIAISKKSFFTSMGILFTLMIISYILTFALPKGLYVDGIYSETNSGNLSKLKFIFAPFLQFGSEGSTTLILIIGLILVIGGVFNALDKSGVMKYMLDRIVSKFKNTRYIMLAVLCLFFMIMGSTVGMYEECVPLVPIVVLLCYALGWDAIVGLAASLLSVGLGFSAGLLNPFTVGVAQSFSSDLVMFSGLGFRLITFIIVYGILMLFLIPYAKKIDKNPASSSVYEEDLPIKNSMKVTLDFKTEKHMDKALIWFASSLAFMVLFVLSAILIRPLTDYIMYVIVLVYLIAGIGAVIISGMSGENIRKNVLQGVIAVLPAIAMILIAASIKYILTEGQVLDTIIYKLVILVSKSPKGIAILLIYLVVLICNFMIPSGSAKAALIMPVIYPLVDAIGISHQTAVLAFIYGDGFSNVIFPTNPVLLIALGLTTVSYMKWFKWSFKLQLTILAATSVLLIIADQFIY